MGDGDGEVILKRGGSPRTEYQSNPSSNWYFPERYDYSIRVTADNVSLKNITIGGWERQNSTQGWVVGVSGSSVAFDSVIFHGQNIRSAVVVYEQVSNLTIRNCIFSGGYYESAIRGGALNIILENNQFTQSHWYGGPLHFDDRFSLSGKISYNYFTYAPGTLNGADDFNQSGLGFNAIGIYTSKLDDQLLIQHNTFSWESVDATNDYENRAQTAAIYVKDFPGLNGSRLVIKDNIFAGYQTVEKDDDHKKAPWKNQPGKFGQALDFDGEDDFATFLSPDLAFGDKGTLAFWVNLYDTSKRNTILLGPQGED